MVARWTETSGGESPACLYCRFAFASYFLLLFVILVYLFCPWSGSSRIRSQLPLVGRGYQKSWRPASPFVFFAVLRFLRLGVLSCDVRGTFEGPRASPGEAARKVHLGS